MNILVVCQNIVSGEGQGRVNVEVVQELLRRRHSVTIVADRVDRDLADHPRVAWVEISVAGIPTQLLKDLVFTSFATWHVRRQRADHDLVFTTGFTLWGRSDLCAVHYVHDAWLQSPVHTSKVHSGIYGAYQWLYTRLHCWLERHAFERSRHVIAVSEKIKEELEAIGVSATRIEVIANGVDIQEFSPATVDRTSLGIPEGPPLALFVGDIRTPRKNLDTVLHALVSVPELHLAVAGTVTDSPYPALSTSLGIDDRVHFLDFRSDIPDLMRAADLFVFPSRYEACTLVLLEAMASGLPVITAATAGGAELVPPEAGIVLDDPDDIAGLGQALQHLAGFPATREAMGEAARAVAERHSWKDMAQQYVESMEDLHASSPNPSPGTSIRPARAL